MAEARVARFKSCLLRAPGWAGPRSAARARCPLCALHEGRGGEAAGEGAQDGKAVLRGGGAKGRGGKGTREARKASSATNNPALLGATSQKRPRGSRRLPHLLKGSAALAHPAGAIENWAGLGTALRKPHCTAPAPPHPPLSSARNCSPSSSLPRAPRNTLCGPRRAMPVATLAGAPPGCGVLRGRGRGGRGSPGTARCVPTRRGCLRDGSCAAQSAVGRRRGYYRKGASGRGSRRSGAGAARGAEAAAVEAGPASSLVQSYSFRQALPGGDLLLLLPQLVRQAVCTSAAGAAGAAGAFASSPCWAGLVLHDPTLPRAPCR